MCQTCSSNCCKCSLTQGVCINKGIMRAVVLQTKANLQKPLLHRRHTENFIHHAAFSSTARLFLIVKQMYVQVISVKLVAVVLKSSQGQKAMMRQSRFQNSQDMCYRLAGAVSKLAELHTVDTTSSVRVCIQIYMPHRITTPPSKPI